MTRTDLPSFTKPPVIETVLGIQFEPIPNFTNGHLGAFWSQLGGRTAWPHVSDAAPLPQDFERFGEEQQWNAEFMNMRLALTQIPALRMQMRRDDRMLQLQNGKLIYNWLGNNGNEYARYKTIRQEFNGYVSELSRFLVDQGLAVLQANQWEIIYINHLPKGTVWHGPEDWHGVFNFQAVPPARVNDCQLENVVAQWAYEIPPRRGRLRVNLVHGRAGAESGEILAFNLTARGPVGEGEGSANHEDGLDLGHEVIVKAFTELASPNARQYWEQEV